MKKLNPKTIAIDIDEVTADFISYFVYFHNLMYKTNFSKDKIASYYLHEAFETEKNEMGLRFAEFQSLHLLEEVKPSEGAIEGIKSLIKRGFSPVFVTARPKTIEKETKLWLQKYFGNNKLPVFFTHQASGMPKLKKSQICKSIGAEILIDDHIDNAIDCAQNGIKVFLFDAPWNQTDDLPQGVIRVKSWKEIQKLLL